MKTFVRPASETLEQKLGPEVMARITEEDDRRSLEDFRSMSSEEIDAHVEIGIDSAEVIPPAAAIPAAVQLLGLGPEWVMDAERTEKLSSRRFIPFS